MKIKRIAKKSLLVCFIIFIISSNICASEETEKNLSSVAFVQGTNAFKKGEWMSSVFLLRKALSYQENNNAETLYMLITAEMYAGEYKSAYNDCQQFLDNFSSSQYVSYILYHKGRALFYLGEYEKSILTLSDYCHQYPEHEMYASALFWIGESFYASFNYNESKLLYERILNEFPNDSKASSAQYRIETINQRAREEKLLYLLRETGEEYLAAKEDYERQLKLYGSETAEEVRRRLITLQEKNAQLESKISEYEKNISALKEENKKIKDNYEKTITSIKEESEKELKDMNSELIKILKEKANQTQILIEKQKVGQ